MSEKEKKRCNECVSFGSRMFLGWDRDILHMHCKKLNKDINGTIPTAKNCPSYKYKKL